MRINGTYYITKQRGTKNIITNLFADISRYSFQKEFSSETSNMYRWVSNIYKIITSNYSAEHKNKQLTRLYVAMDLTEDEIKSRLYENNATSKNDLSIANKDEVTAAKDEVIIACQNLINFFNQFDFKPSFRFVNTLVLCEDPMEYTRNYFKIFDSQYALDVAEKIKSAEYSAILKSIRACIPKNIINTHFEIFFGEPGGGKTTYAYNLCSKRIVCSSEMLPDALMQVFDFEEGKAKFKQSDLWLAMENGESILLDEFNMLPYESLKFIQGITDNKEEFDFKGFKIKIHKNFKIIGTMNLYTEQGCIPISHALADRASNIREFIVTAEDLASSLI